MATKRSPILGYNHNFRHRGRVFHVQTEDSGVDNPHVFTHLFHGGVIISSRKLDYDRESSEESVKALMQAQHKAMLRDLKKGTFDEKIVSYLGPHPDDAPDLPSGHVPATAVAPDDDGAPEIEIIADTEPTPVPAAVTESASEPAPAPPAAPAQRPRTTPPPAVPAVTVEFSKPKAVVPDDDEPGVVHSPAPASAPVPPGASSYIQHGTVRREAPLINTGQMAAVMDPRDVRSQHGDKDTGVHSALSDESARVRSTPTPTPSSGVQPPRPAHPPTLPPARPPTRPVAKPPATPPARPAAKPPATPPARAPQPTPIPSSAAAAAGRRTASRSTTHPREQGGSGVVVSRPSVIVGAPPRVVGGGAGGRSTSASSAPPPSQPVRSRARAAREEPPQDSLFGSDLISEKSLDEVILAYLSEDPSDD